MNLRFGRIYQLNTSEKLKIDIVILGYKRIDHLNKVLVSVSESLKCLKDYTNLNFILSIDYCLERPILRNEIFDGLPNVKFRFHEKNLGLRRHIYHILREFKEGLSDALILIEDDIVLDTNALKYFLGMLEDHYNSEEVFQISGYSPVPFNQEVCDVSAFSRISTWGWATWKHKLPNIDHVCLDWDSVKDQESILSEISVDYKDLRTIARGQLNGTVHSWSLDFQLYMLRNNLFTIYPNSSLVNNIGFDGSGVNYNVGKGSSRILSILEKFEKRSLSENITFNKKQGIVSFWMKWRYSSSKIVRRFYTLISIISR